MTDTHVDTGDIQALSDIAKTHPGKEALQRDVLIKSRDRAGARYAAAVKELRASLVELGAIETVLADDANTPEPVRRLRSFSSHQPDQLAELRHENFVPSAPSRIRDDVKAAAAALRVACKS